jgi:hypothetical protein
MWPNLASHISSLSLSLSHAWIFNDARRQHRPITLAALVAEEYNIITTGNRDSGAGERVARK